jgi:hypothetical protein
MLFTGRSGWWEVQASRRTEVSRFAAGLSGHPPSTATTTATATRSVAPMIPHRLHESRISTSTTSRRSIPVDKRASKRGLFGLSHLDGRLVERAHCHRFGRRSLDAPSVTSECCLLLVCSVNGFQRRRDEASRAAELRPRHCIGRAMGAILPRKRTRWRQTSFSGRFRRTH